MRRPIIQKTPNSQIILDLTNSRFTEESMKETRPQTSFKYPEITFESQGYQSDDSSQSIQSFRKSQFMYLETFGNIKEDLAVQVDPIKPSSKTISSSKFYSRKTSRPKQKPSKNLNFVIRGRPLTATSAYPESRKTPHLATLKKRSSVFSYGESDLLTPLDPKFLDEDTDYFSKLIHSKNSIGVLANSNNLIENPGTFDYFDRSFSPKVEGDHSKVEKIGLIVSTPYCLTRPVRKVGKKGKLVKGLSSKPVSAQRSKLVHNIVVSQPNH